MQNHKAKIFISLLCLLSGTLFFVNIATSKKAVLDIKQGEYYLKGTIEEVKDFNFQIAPGSSVSDQITIINNTDSQIDYTISSVDSETNNQGLVVFKNTWQENPNIGQWLKFDQQEVTVRAKERLSLPFTINVPAGSYPGTYYGGISIQKKSSKSENADQPSFAVKVQTRQVLGLIVDIPGTVDRTFQFGDLQYDSMKGRYQFTINNTGNALLSFEGNLAIASSDLFSNFQEEIIIEKFRILPQNNLTKIILAPRQPLFGLQEAALTGELKVYDAVLDESVPLASVEKKVTTHFFAWNIIQILAGALCLLILLTLANIIAEKHYLKQCISYAVDKNESLEDIAKKFGMHWKKLAKINKLRAPYALKPDQKILVHESKIHKPS